MSEAQWFEGICDWPHYACTACLKPINLGHPTLMRLTAPAGQLYHPECKPTVPPEEKGAE